MRSEVAKVLTAIDAQDEAGRRALTDSDMVAKYLFTPAWMRRMQRGDEQLQRLTPPERVLEMVMHHLGRRDGASTVSHYDTPVA